MEDFNTNSGLPDTLPPDPSLPSLPTAPAPVVKKGGFFGKLIALLLGIVIGVVGTFGGVFLLAYSVPANKVAGLVGVDLHDYLEKEYAEQTILGMFGAVGSAVKSTANGSATLQDFDDISPKVGEAVEKLGEKMTGYGLSLDSEQLMVTPLSGMQKFFEEAIYNSYACDILGDDMLDRSPMLMAICYGEKNVDYTIDDNGDVQMVGEAMPRTIQDLRDMGNSIFDDIALADLMEIGHDDTMMMYLAYGKEGIHYEIVDDEVVMLRERMAILNGSPYNEYGEPLEGTLNGTSTYTEDGNTYYLIADATLGTVRTPDGEATLYYLNNTENQEFYFHQTTVGDLTHDPDIISKITKRLTVGDILGDDTALDNKFLKHVKDETIDSLPSAVDNLTLLQVFDTEVFIMDDAKENFLDKNGNPTTDKNEYTVNSEWWYLLHTEAHPDCLGAHKDSNGNRVPCTIACIDDYKVTDMNKLIDNMRRNIEASSLNKLKNDGMIDALDSSSLQQDVRYQIVGVSIEAELDAEGIPHGNGEKLGDLTVAQMLKYVNVIFAHLDDVGL
ncbi:MAG: hypothetical protein IJX87_06630 [Clostridia bacterium]|nr:hypothetical protein [Clostridia bacterium]